MLDHRHACLRTGLVRTGTNWRYSSAEVDFIVEDADVRIVLVQDIFVSALAPEIGRWQTDGRIMIGFGPDHGLPLSLETAVSAQALGAEWPSLAADDPVARS